MTTSPRLRPVARLAWLSLAALLLLPPHPASAAPTATTVSTIRTSRWIPRSPDPTGLSNLPNRNALLVVDSEVDETPHFTGKNAWVTSVRGVVLRAFSTMRYTAEPADVAVGGVGNVMYITDDSIDRVFVVRMGRDKVLGTRDDRVSSISTRAFGSNDPAGIGFGARSLWITDGDNDGSDQRVYRVRRGANGVYDGVPPTGDDVVTWFSTAPLGLRRPTDVHFQGANAHLYIVSAPDRAIVETTLDGALVASWEITDDRLMFPAGVAIAPASADPSQRSVYVADRRLDNDSFPNENDGRIFELSLVP
jgi:hypothetical protein